MDEFHFPYLIGAVVDRNDHSGAGRPVRNEPCALQWVHVRKSSSLDLMPTAFFLSGVLPPLTADLAAAAREVPGLGCKRPPRSVRSDL